MKVPRPSAALAFLVAFSICSFLTRIRLHRRYGWDWGQWPRVVLGIVLAFLTFPLRMTERLLTNKTLQRSRIFPPVFIVGHWRSGTTLLHTLISQDPQFGFVPSYQVFATKFSDLCEFEVAKKIINGLIPVNRDFDKVELKFEGPQEEELAIADRVPYSVFHCYCFPKNLKDLLRYVTLEGVPQHEIDRLRIAYSTVLRKAHLVMNGKQLLIKNPANTGRMHELMSWFPGCKFIHIYRNPYATARSYLHMNQTMCRACSLQDFDDNLVWRNTLESIATVEGKYLKDRPTMPPGTLAEVKYEEFMQNPVQELARVYKELNIQGFEAAAPKFQQFLKTQAEFQPNVFKWKRELVADVNDSCGFLFEPYGYQKLSPADMDSVVDPKTSNSKLSQKDTTAEKKTE